MEAGLSDTMRKALFVLSCVLLAIGMCGGPLILRLYFVEGATRLWLSCWSQTAGWPIILLPLLVSYFRRRKTDGVNTQLIAMKLPVFIAAAFIGFLAGTINYLYAYGAQRLPVSTSSLIVATQLVFNAIFAFLLVRQKFNSYTVNTIVLLTLGAATLALHASSDKPQGESNKMYAMGFVVTFVAAILSGLLFPSIELVYKKANQAVTYTLVLEIQMVINFFATILATIGMLVTNDFKLMPHEARQFHLGEVKYYVVIFSSAIIWQFNMLGAAGIIFCASALVSGIFGAVLLPVTEVLAVVFFHDKFQVEKALSLVLCLWGFLSHFYGEYKDGKKKKQQVKESEMTSAAVP